jgi:hypothetical protein
MIKPSKASQATVRKTPRQLSMDVGAGCGKPVDKPAPGIPAWVLQERRGEAFRSACLQRCTKCRAPILYGLDADICALSARADPTPLTPLGEAIALLDGRRTFNLTETAGRIEITARDFWAIGGESRHPVIPEHKCNSRLDAHMQPTTRRARYSAPDEPQF